MIPRHPPSDFYREGVARKGRERPGSETLSAELTVKQTGPSSQVQVGTWMLGGPRHQLSR